jgi:hypothetical protein
MKMYFIFLVLLVYLSGGCAYHSRSEAFEPLAAQFKAKAGTNRIVEGRKIAGLLPVCPVVHGRWWYFGFDESVPAGADDMSRPSYLLSKEDFLQAMGKPSRFQVEDLRHGIWDVASYDLGRDRNNTAWELLATFRSNNVVRGRVIKRYTPSSVATHINPDGSITSVTNYLPEQ